MMTYKNDTIKTSVRRLVEFLLREGSITSSTSFKIDTEAMLAGGRIHRKIQSKQKATYQAEVMLKMSWEEEDYRLELEGRADGIDRINSLYYIDEIKGVYRDVTKIESPDLLHLAQAKCYAYMYATQFQKENMGIQITYCNLETEEIHRLWQEYSYQELQEWFDELLRTWKKWASYLVNQRKDRNQSIKSLQFPYSYREGQKKMSAIVYQTVSNHGKVFLQAPTGVGKTLATIYPSLKAMEAGKAQRIYYLTAKTITRTVAEDTIRLLQKQNLRLKAITITAKEKICPNEIFECHPSACPMAKGHFDRINDALFQLLQKEDMMDRKVILEYANRFQVCPYELSFEAAEWSDLMICDYNYAFDPMVYRQSLTQESFAQIFLIDEAHNLLERAREMYSASIVIHQFDTMKGIFKEKSKAIYKRVHSCRKILKSWEKGMESIHQARESVDELYFPLFRTCNDISEYMTDHPEVEEMDEILEIYFCWKYFLQVMDEIDEGYQIYEEKKQTGYQVRLFCVDPSTHIKEYIRDGNSAVFFSATLLPVHYYKKLLYNENADAFSVQSPFDAANSLRVIANDVTSRYRMRDSAEYRKILFYLEKTVSLKPGNYMVFFPSYEMMQQVYEEAGNSTLDMLADLMPQRQDMNETEREAFLQEFRSERGKSLIGMCVLGSLYSEGIDLTGNRLIGVFIVGTGLPGLSFERKMIMEYFNQKKENGYDYAYRYPGINRVLQAAGRVIRTMDDRGIIVLMDDRFLWKENLSLLPYEWDRYYESNHNTYGIILESFWNGSEEKGE